MVSVSTLLGSADRQKLIYLFIIEGIATMWRSGFYADDDVPDITGSGGGSWVGTSYGARTVKPGLALSDPIFEAGINPSAGMILDDDITVKLTDDESDYLAALFKGQWEADELTRLGERIPPGEDPADVTKNGWDQLSAVTIRDRHIGNEYIGSAGERRELYITPDTGDGQPPGLDHPILGDQADGELPEVMVAASPHNFAGRRCAIYRLVFDEEAGTWDTWQNHYDGGAMIWYGTLTDRAIYRGSGQWELTCAGPASWLRKRLGLHMSTKEWLVSPDLLLSQDQGTDETWVGAFFQRHGYGDVDKPDHVLDYNFNFHTDNRLSTTNTLSAMATRLFDVLRTACTGAGVGGVGVGTNDTTAGKYYNDEQAGYDSTCDTDDGREISIKIVDSRDDDDLLGFDGQFAGVCRIVLHEKVWAALGWDVNAKPAIATFIGMVQGFFAFEDPLNIAGGPVEPPGPGYFVGHFSTTGANAPFASADNDGIWRTWKGSFFENVLILDKGGEQFVSVGYGKVYIEGQKGRPAANGITVNGTAVDSTAVFAFQGRVLVPGSEDVVDHIEVAKVSWVTEADGSVRQDANDRTVLYIERWLDPRRFGWNARRFYVGETKITAWKIYAGQLTMRQILVLPWTNDSVPGRNWRAATRILTSSGTSTAWTPGDDPTPPTEGDNAPTSGDFWGSDLEFQDYGLNIEPDRVDFGAWEREASTVLEKQSNLNRFSWASATPVLSQDVLQSLHQTRGWCMRWTKGTTGPQFSVFSPFTWITPEDVDVTLTESDIHGKPGDPLSWTIDQDLRWEAPIDWFEITAGVDPILDDSSFTGRQKSYDKWARGRAGNVERIMSAKGLVDPTLFWRDSDWDDARWFVDWVSLHCKSIAPWYAERHFTVTTKRLAGAKANNLYPGAIVSITDQRILAPDGTYGVTSHVGYVTRCSHFLGGQAEATILLQARDTSAFRFWAAIAVVEGFNTSAKTLTLSSDMADHGGDQADATGFEEPPWSTDAGDEKLRVIQSEDGETFPSADDVTLTGASVSGNVLTYTSLDGGTLRPDTFKYLLFQSATDHTATHWPVLRLAITTDETGDYSGNQGFELL